MRTIPPRETRWDCLLAGVADMLWTMQKEYREKPTERQVEVFKQELERLLSSHGVRIRIELYEHPMVIHTLRNGQDTGSIHHWIDRVVLSTPTVEELEVELYAQGIDDETIQHVFTEACGIQSQLYEHLKRNPGHPGSGDPYWELWEKQKERHEGADH